MEAQINLLIEGPRGTGAKEFNNKGLCLIYVDPLLNEQRSDQIIEVNAFFSSGPTYKRREKSNIIIEKNRENIFHVDFEKLCKALEKKQHTDSESYFSDSNIHALKAIAKAIRSLDEGGKVNPTLPTSFNDTRRDSARKNLINILFSSGYELEHDTYKLIKSTHKRPLL